MSDQILSPSRHEPRDVRFKYIVAGASFMAAAMAVVLLAALWMFPHTMTDQYVATPLPRPAPPLLQSSPRAEMNAFRAQQMQQLNGTYWLDREHKIVHLPIEQAMRKLAVEGIPDWPAPKQAKP